MVSGTISVPKSFFRKERDIYWNWREAFWRELFQNSSDARAKRIDIVVETVFRDEGNVTRITFNDNGCGMDRDVLEDVYFALGQTTKTSGDTVGGFGRARILTCFSMERYSIKTKNLHVEGDGAYYELSETDEYIKGCHIEIDIEQHAADSSDMLRQLYSYLKYCQASNIEIVINGDKWTDWCHKGRHIRDMVKDDIKYGTIHANKSGGRFGGTVIVRVDGIMMFCQCHNADAQIVIEIDKAHSMQALTAGRDSFAQGYDGPLSRLIQELSVNCVSASKGKQRKTVTVRGKGFRVTKRPEKEQSVIEHIDATGTDGNLQYSSQSALTQRIERGDYKSHMVSSSQEHTSETYGNDDHFDLLILDESESSKISRVINRYNPKNWQTGDKSEQGTGSTIQKLLQMWEVALDQAVLALMEAYENVDTLYWTSGWIFSEDVEAAYRQACEGHVFYLNPVDEQGRLKFKLRNRMSQKKLMAMAKHEVAHSLCSDHNEVFANIQTTIDEHFDERVAFSRMKAI